MTAVTEEVRARSEDLLGQGQKRILILEFVRVGIYVLLLVLTVMSQFAQVAFFNWEFVAPLYSILACGFALHFVVALKSGFFIKSPVWMGITFLLDVVFITLLVFYSGLNQAFFLFMYLVNILLAGLTISGNGAVMVALLSSIGFTLNSILGPDIKVFSTLFMIVLNNIAFFSVAGISGYLNEQLDFLGLKLLESAKNLSELKNLQALILSNVPVAVLTTEIDGEIVQFNEVSEEILGRKELQKANVLGLLPNLKVMTDKLKRTDKIQVEEVATQVRGDKKTLRCHLSWLLTDGEKRGFLFVMEDVTQVRHLEFNLRQSEKMAAVGQLAAGIAHEIRNPLASISGSIEMLSQTTSNDDDRKLMKIVLREIDRLNNLISEFLDYSKPPKPPESPLQINALMSEMLDSLKLNANLVKSINTEVELKSESKILADRDKLKQAMLNIIINAYQAMGDSSNGKLSVKTWDEVGFVKVSVKDNGCGMSEETKRKMFEPFHTTKAKGTGLGLAITHKIFENHKAVIFVESEQGKGTEFTIRFPILES